MTHHVTHKNEWRHTYEWFISHMNESCHISISQVTRVSCHIYHVNEWYHTYGWVMWHTSINHVSHMTHYVTHTNESRQRYVTHTHMLVPIRYPHHTTIRVDFIYILVNMYIYTTSLFAWILCTCMYMYICITSPFTYHMNVHTCMHIYMHIYTYIYIYIYTYISIYV